MPSRPQAHRLFVAGPTGRSRRLFAATLSTGLTLPVLLFSLLAMPGCRSDQASRPSLSSLSPTRWFAKSEEPADDEFHLQPVPPTGGYDTPPVPPPISPGRAFVPLAPPSSAPADPGSFYGVRPTGAEETGPAKAPWAERFRNLLRREKPQEPSPLRPVPLSRRDASAALQTAQQSLLPPLPLPPRAPAVALGRPIFDPIAPVALSAVHPADSPSRYQPRPIASRERLPVIVPAGSSQAQVPAVEPAAWPYAVADQPLLAAATPQTGSSRILADEPAPYSMRHADPLADRSNGPLLIR